MPRRPRAGQDPPTRTGPAARRRRRPGGGSPGRSAPSRDGRRRRRPSGPPAPSRPDATEPTRRTGPARPDAAGDVHREGDQLGDDRRGGGHLTEASAAAHHAQGDDTIAGASGPPWPVLRASCPRETLTRIGLRRSVTRRLAGIPAPVHLGAGPLQQPARRRVRVMPAAKSAVDGPGRPGRVGGRPARRSGPLRPQ